MDERLAPLFTPWKIGNLEIKNRIVLTSMGGTDLFGRMEKNHFDSAGAEFIMRVAKNNAGLVLPGCQPVYNPMFGQWLHKNKGMYKKLKEWMPEFHKTGANVDFYDPFIPKYREKGQWFEGLKEINTEILNGYDLVCITTAHSTVDYDMVCNAGVPVFDCKNITKNIANKANVEVL